MQHRFLHFDFGLGHLNSVIKTHNYIIIVKIVDKIDCGVNLFEYKNIILERGATVEW